jgi:hypothetical protein
MRNRRTRPGAEVRERRSIAVSQRTSFSIPVICDAKRASDLIRLLCRAVFRRTQFFKIQSVDWLVIFLLQTSRRQLMDYWKRTFAGT